MYVPTLCRINWTCACACPMIHEPIFRRSRTEGVISCFTHTYQSRSRGDWVSFELPRRETHQVQGPPDWWKSALTCEVILHKCQVVRVDTQAKLTKEVNHVLSETLGEQPRVFGSYKLLLSLGADRAEGLRRLYDMCTAQGVRRVARSFGGSTLAGTRLPRLHCQPGFHHRAWSRVLE